MHVEQRKWTSDGGWEVLVEVDFAKPPQLVLAFGARGVVSDQARFEEIKNFYGEAHVIMGSTAGEIHDEQVNDESITLAAISFDKTELQFVQTEISDSGESMEVGKKLASELPHERLVHVMLFSDGLKVDGTDLVKGLTEVLPDEVSVTGGLVGDGSDFKETVVGLDAVPVSGKVIVVGFYGDALRVGYGSLGGWDAFGPEREITKSEGNVLYEIDGKPALELYKEYLGDKAAELPSSGLLFPMSLKLENSKGEEIEVVRTVLSVSEEDQSMTFAGSMPQGVKSQLMKANFERLIDGAATAATMSIESLSDGKAQLAVLVSCVGRKLVLKERVEEEIEAVRYNVGPDAAIIGFYSYGELCPTAATERQCRLHNQTMTITTFYEV